MSGHHICMSISHKFITKRLKIDDSLIYVTYIGLLMLRYKRIELHVGMSIINTADINHLMKICIKDVCLCHCIVLLHSSEQWCLYNRSMWERKKYGFCRWHSLDWFTIILFILQFYNSGYSRVLYCLSLLAQCWSFPRWILTHTKNTLPSPGAQNGNTNSLSPWEALWAETCEVIVMYLKCNTHM